ncbi:hypothetical protein BaRGS_00016687 [Batillaria attramentaria]|uniref:Uncharacterized protein n=1 Tax=Batillaria attramentaria TaxID=370345 RepID=A0ABD0KXK8_9CAEN
MADAAAPVQNSVCPPSSKSSSSVSERLGTPDPTFLATHSSPSCFNRAYVPNPAVPALTVDPARLFSVVSYNILAECARTRNDYSYTAPEFLGQEYRHGLLMKELQYLNGDIVCLQEVNPAYFNTVLLPDMKKLGYDGLMMKRTKDYYDEGEATFYKTALFELESSKRVSLTEVARKSELYKRVVCRIFVCIHRRWRLEVEPQKWVPAVMKYLDRADCRAHHEAAQSNHRQGPALSATSMLSGIPCASPDVQCYTGSLCYQRSGGSRRGRGSTTHHLRRLQFGMAQPSLPARPRWLLSDASIRKLQAVERLELNEGSGSEPEITTFTVHMHNSVDYVFFSSGSLVPVGVLKTVDKAVVDATGGLPDRDFASDHLAMKAVMAFTN